MTKNMNTKTPYIWLQDGDLSGKAECGCELVDAWHWSGAALFQCALHATAFEICGNLKDGVKITRLIEKNWAKGNLAHVVRLLVRWADNAEKTTKKANKGA